MSGHKEKLNLGNIYDEKHHIRRNEFVFCKSVGENWKSRSAHVICQGATAVTLNV